MLERKKRGWGREKDKPRKREKGAARKTRREKISFARRTHSEDVCSARGLCQTSTGRAATTTHYTVSKSRHEQHNCMKAFRQQLDRERFLTGISHRLHQKRWRPKVRTSTAVITIQFHNQVANKQWTTGVKVDRHKTTEKGRRKFRLASKAPTSSSDSRVTTATRQSRVGVKHNTKPQIIYNSRG